MNKLNYNKLNKILYDNNNIVSYINNSAYSIFDDENLSTYFLEELIGLGDNNSLINILRDVFNVLNCIKKGYNLNVIYSNNYFYSNKTEINDYLFENNMIKTDLDDINVSHEISKLNTSQLTELLKKYNLPFSGKRKKLIKCAVEKIPKYEFILNDVELTIHGEKFLTDYDWINIYEFALNKFDFNDFYNYINENKGEVFQLASDFIELHIKNAKSTRNLIYLDDCYVSESFLYIFNSDYENALNWELQRFILRLNPVFSYLGYYSEYLIFNPDNIHRIILFMDKLKIKDITEIFYDIWKSSLKKEYVSKETAFNFLKRSFDENLDKLSDEYNDKYFEIPQEYMMLSKDFYKYHDFSLAGDFFEFALEMDPNMQDALFYKALSYCHEKDYKWALKLIDEALDIDSNNARYWCVKAIISFETHKTNLAFKYFKKALNLNHEDSFILNSIGVCYSHNNKSEDAIKYFKKAMQCSNDIYPRLNLAKIHVEQKNWSEAEVCFDEIEKISGQTMDYLFEKGCYYLIRNDYKNAINYFNNCCNNHYKHITILSLKYLALNELGRTDLYEEFKTKLSKLDLKFIKALENFLEN